MIASLPMYDQPPMQAANDALWQATRTALGHGPKELTRRGDLWDHWTSPDLLLSQTCGLPYRAKLHSRVQLVGTPDFALPDCPPGHYTSVLLTRRADRITALEELASACFAYNEPLSQSGWAAPNTLSGFAYGSLLETGAHQASAEAVRDGRADFAALDARTWAILSEHTALGDTLEILTQTAPTPGLPYITSANRAPETLLSALRTALETLAPKHRAALGIASFVQIPKAAYLAQPLPPKP